MPTYQLHLLIAALVKLYTFQELERGVGIIPILVRQLGFPLKVVKEIVKAASDIKRIRAQKQEVEPEIFYLH